MRSLLLLVLLAGCDLTTGPAFPGVPLTPDPSWRADWAAMEQCSGRTGDFDRVRWFASPVGALGYTHGAPNRAYWFPKHDIYLTTATLVGFDLRRAVRHEILHDLLQGGGAGSADHGPEFTICGV